MTMDSAPGVAPHGGENGTADGGADEEKLQIFKGLLFWIVDRSARGILDLQRLIADHGGVHEGQSLTSATHIVVDNLAVGGQTWRDLTSRVKRGTVVTSAWLADSAREGRRLPAAAYMPKSLAPTSSILSLAGAKRAALEVPEKPPEKKHICLEGQAAPPKFEDQARSGCNGSFGVVEQSMTCTPLSGRLSPGVVPHMSVEANLARPAGLADRAQLAVVVDDLSGHVLKQVRAEQYQIISASLRLTLEPLSEWCGSIDVTGAVGGSTFRAMFGRVSLLADRASSALKLEHTVGGWVSVRRISIRLHLCKTNLARAGA